jgi:hypothetical protein
MNRIIFDSGISLDGFFAGDNRSPGKPMGNNARLSGHFKKTVTTHRQQ